MMRAHIAAFFCVLLLSAQAAADCPLLVAPAGKVPLVTRKPVQGDDARLVSSFGMRYHPLLNQKRMHTGVDWAVPVGAPVLAAGAGRVVSARRDGEYGNIVVIDHGAGITTAYAHLSSFAVHDGDCVAARATIGAAGATGLASTPGVHFEVRRDGVAVDPYRVEPSGK